MRLSGSSGRRAPRQGVTPRLRVAARRCAVALLPLTLGACSWAVLDPRGPVGHADRKILIDSLAIMLAIGVPTILATFAFAWWFRASNTRARYRPEWEFSGAIELVVWSIPAMVIILLGGVAWIGSHDLDPAKPLSSDKAPLEIQVVSLDWKWLFIYPEHGIASVNHLVVPAGVPLSFSLTSASVWNAFFVPQLGSMIYTMNGMRTPPQPAGRRAGHVPGPVGALQRRRLLRHALPGPRRARRGVRGLGQGDARRRPQSRRRRLHGARAQSSSLPPSTYGAVTPELFAQVVRQELAPGPGPGTERGGAAEASKHPEPAKKGH